jgi:hypothetical protein
MSARPLTIEKNLPEEKNSARMVLPFSLIGTCSTPVAARPFAQGRLIEFFDFYIYATTAVLVFSGAVLS